MSINDKNIALALGGGGARGIAHIHVLKAFDDLGLKPAVISGSSIGAIVGAGYASGMTGAEIEAHFISTFTSKSNFLSKLWKARTGPIQAIMDSSNAGFGQFDVEKVLDVFLPPQLPDDFSDLKIPLKVTGTDYYGNALKVMEEGPLMPAIAASAAIPVVFNPVKIDGCILIDGGIANPLPFDLLPTENHFNVAVDVVGLPRGKPGTYPSRIDAGFGASQLMMQAITNLKLNQNPPDLFLRPDVDAYRVLDFLKVNEIIDSTRSLYDEAKYGLETFLKSAKSSAST